MKFSENVSAAFQSANCYKCGKQLPLYYKVDVCTCDKSNWFPYYSAFESLAGSKSLRDLLYEKFPKAKKHTIDNMVLYLKQLYFANGIMRIYKSSNWKFNSTWHTYRKAKGALKLLEEAGWVEMPPAFVMRDGKKMSLLVATPVFWKEVAPLVNKEKRSFDSASTPHARFKENDKVRYDASTIEDVKRIPKELAQDLLAEKIKEIAWLNDNYFAHMEVKHPSISIFSNVKLTRIFNEEGMGRLHQVNAGTFHFQALSGDERRKITLNGHRVVELDFSACHLSLVLAEAGIEVTGDAYMPVVYSLLGREDEELRGVVKKAVMLALNTSSIEGKRGSYKQSWGEQYEELAILKKFNLTPMDVLKHIQSTYPTVEFCAGRANELMYKESEVMVRILMRLARKGIPALPVHDSLMVVDGFQTTTQEIMEEEWMMAVGYKPTVTSKT